MAKKKKKAVKTIKKLQDEFVRDMTMIAKSSDTHTSSITRDQFRRLTSMSRVDFESLGSFTDLRKKFFPPVVVPEIKQGASLIQSHRAKLEKLECLTTFIANEMTRL